MLKKDRNFTPRQGSTRLAAIRVHDIDDSLEVIPNPIIIIYSGLETIHPTVRLPSSSCLIDHLALPTSMCNQPYVT